jgi:hypothetical protein
VGKRNLCCSLADCPVVHTVESQHRTLCLEVAQRSPDLKVVAGAFACCAVAVAETETVQDGWHLMEQQCCMILA